MTADQGPLSGPEPAESPEIARQRARNLRVYAKRMRDAGDVAEADWAEGLACGWDNWAVWQETDAA